MKRIVLTVFFFTVLIANGYSQIEKGTILLGGYANLTTIDDDFMVTLYPNSGIFLTDKFCLGVSLPILFDSDDIYWGFSPFGRYYFKAKESRSLFVLASVGIADIIDPDHTFNGSNLGLGIGHVWLLNKSVGFEVTAQGNTDFEDFRFDLLLGFQIYLGKSKE